MRLASRVTWILGALTLTALLMRLPGYLAWWFNPDEAIYWQTATFKAGAAWRMILGNAHPPLFYLVLRGLANLGDSPLLLRLPSLVAGVALVPLAFSLTRRLFGARAGLVAAALVCFSPSAIVLSQVMRPYALQNCMLALALLGLTRYLRGDSWRHLALYGTAMSLAIGLQYSSAIALGGIGVTLAVLTLSRRLDRRQVLALAAAHVLPFAALAFLYFKHIAVHLEGSAMQAQARDWWLNEQFIRNPSQAFSQIRDVCWAQFGGLRSALPALALTVLAVWRTRTPQDWMLPLAVLATAVALSGAGLYPLGGTRHSAYLLVLLTPAVAAGVATLLENSRHRVVVGTSVVGIALLGASAWQGMSVSLVRGGEGAVTRAEAAEVERFLREEVPTDAVVLTDDETLQLLQALLDSRRTRFRPHKETRLSWSRVGTRRFGFLTTSANPHPIWALPWIRGETRDGACLERALDLVEQDPELAERLEADGLWVLSGGWSSNLLAGDGSRAATAPPLFDRSAGGVGLGICRLDRAAYRAYLAED